MPPCLSAKKKEFLLSLRLLEVARLRKPLAEGMREINLSAQENSLTPEILAELIKD